MLIPLSAIIGQLDIIGVAIVPPEADAKLIVHPDAVLPGAAALQSFQMVAGPICFAITAQSSP
jgi:hypothetical protein